jgi:hypothetical protein
LFCSIKVLTMALMMSATGFVIDIAGLQCFCNVIINPIAFASGLPDEIAGNCPSAGGIASIGHSLFEFLSLQFLGFVVLYTS